MNTSQNGRQFIESYEALRTVAYKPTPNDVWTIGYGHTLGVKEGDICTPLQADQWMSQDLARVEHVINECVTVPINQNQFDALVSFAFNVGAMAFQHSTLLKLLNAGDTQGATSQFLAWDKQAGKVLHGLTLRRIAEAAMFARPV